MKRVLILVSLLFASSAFANGMYVGIQGGSSDGYRTMAVSIGNSKGGIFLGFRNDQDISNNDLLDYTIPHHDFTQKRMRVGDSFAFGGQFRKNLTRNQSMDLRVGFSGEHTVMVARSNVTGWYYNNGGERYGMKALIGAGYQYNFEKIGLTASYDNFLGTSFGITARF